MGNRRKMLLIGDREREAPGNEKKAASRGSNLPVERASAKGKKRKFMKRSAKTNKGSAQASPR